MKSYSLALARATKVSVVSVILASAMIVTPASANVTIPVEADFFTTAWAFGPPYLRDAGRDSLAVSTPNPFLFDDGPENTWEETTYFTFDFNPADFTGPVGMATLEVDTVARAFGSYPSETQAFAVSAHRVLDDPSTIDPTLASGPGSYVDFKNNQIGDAEDTVSLHSEGLYSWDITDLVNEWITQGDAAFDYSIAMTGRLGNPIDTEDVGGFHAFVNREGGLGGVSAQIVIPEPAALGLLAIGMLGVPRRARSTR